MIRGTTPRLEFELPFNADIVKELYVTFAQGARVVLDKAKHDCTFDGNNVKLKLTQKDTLALVSGNNVDIQLRVLTVNDDALASDIIRSSVSRILKDGEI